MAPIPVGPTSGHLYAQWLDVVHPNTEGTSHAPARHIEQPLTPTDGCQDKLLHDGVTICVQQGFISNFEKRSATQNVSGIEKRLTFTYTWKGYWQNMWHIIREFFHPSGKKHSKRGSGEFVQGNKEPYEGGFRAWIDRIKHRVTKLFYGPLTPEQSLPHGNSKIGNAATLSVEGDKKHQKRDLMDSTLAKVFHKIDGWIKAHPIIIWKRSTGIEEVVQGVDSPQAIARDPVKNSEFASISHHEISMGPLNTMHPANILNGTNLGASESTNHHSSFSGFHFVEAQSVDGLVPLGIPNYALAFKDSLLDTLVGCFFAGVFVFFGIKWVLRALRDRRNRY